MNLIIDDPDKTQIAPLLTRQLLQMPGILRNRHNLSALTLLSSSSV
jgi:hypothetical protein